MAPEPDRTQAWCNACGRQTAYDVLSVHARDRHPAGDGQGITSVIQRRGCGELSLRHSRTTPTVEGGGQVSLPEVSYEPERLWRRPPEWLSQLEEIAPDLKEILDEIYSAANDRQLRLLAMGVRTALDQVMVQIVEDARSFEQKMDRMVAQGHLSARQEEMLTTVIDAGSAAAHRGFKPPRDLLQEMLAVMESIIRDHYITKHMLDALKTHIPPKP